MWRNGLAGGAGDAGPCCKSCARDRVVAQRALAIVSIAAEAKVPFVEHERGGDVDSEIAVRRSRSFLHPDTAGLSVSAKWAATARPTEHPRLYGGQRFRARAGRARRLRQGLHRGRRRRWSAASLSAHAPASVDFSPYPFCRIKDTHPDVVYIVRAGRTPTPRRSWKRRRCRASGTRGIHLISTQDLVPDEELPEYRRDLAVGLITSGRLFGRCRPA